MESSASDLKHQEPASFHQPLVSSVSSIDSFGSLTPQEQDALKSVVESLNIN